MAAWRWIMRNKLLVLAGVLTAGEGAVAMGLPLPGSELIPMKWRGLLIASIGGAAFIARILAQRKEERRNASR